MSNIETHGALQRRYSRICTLAVATTVASGTLALGALLLGSPRAFGLLLVLSSAGWLVTHFVARLAARDHDAGRGYAALPAQPVYALESARPRRAPVVGQRTVWSSSSVYGC